MNSFEQQSKYSSLVSTFLIVFQNFNTFIKVDRVVINPFFGMGKPDYNKMQSSAVDCPRIATINNPGSQ